MSVSCLKSLRLKLYLRLSADSKNFVSVSRCCITFAADGARLASVAGREAVEVEIDHRSGEERQQLREDKPAHHRDAERMAQLRAHAPADHERQRAEHRRHRGYR